MMEQKALVAGLQIGIYSFKIAYFFEILFGFYMSTLLRDIF